MKLALSMKEGEAFFGSFKETIVANAKNETLLKATEDRLREAEAKVLRFERDFNNEKARNEQWKRDYDQNFKALNESQQLTRKVQNELYESQQALAARPEKEGELSQATLKKLQSAFGHLSPMGLLAMNRKNAATSLAAALKLSQEDATAIIEGRYPVAKPIPANAAVVKASNSKPAPKPAPKTASGCGGSQW